MAKGKYKKKRERARLHALHNEANSASDDQSSKRTPAVTELLPAEPSDQGTTEVPKSIVNLPAADRKWWKRSSLTDYVIAFFTVILTVVSGVQGCIIGRQLDVMRNDERAWLKISAYIDPARNQAPVIAGTGSPLAAQIQVENIGKTVAKNIDIRSFVQVLNAGQDPPLEWVDAMDSASDQPSHLFTGMFFPTTKQLLSVVRLDKNGRYRLVTKDEAQGLDMKQKYIAVFGIAYYDDVFKVRH